MKTCKKCKKQFTANRIDQIFCSSKCCSSHHNNNRRNKLKGVQSIHKIQLKNYEIFLLLVPNDKPVVIPKVRLERLGFNFYYYTHRGKPDGNAIAKGYFKKDDELFGLYDFEYAKLDDYNYKIRRDL